MKRILPILAMAFALAACTSKNAFTITGDIEGLADSTVISIARANGEILEATAINGKFTISGNVDIPEFVSLSGRPVQLMRQFFIQPGNITISGTPRQLQVNGTEDNDAYSAYINDVIQFFQDMVGAASEEERMAMTRNYPKIIKRNAEANNNYAGLLILSEMVHTMEVQDVLDRLEQYPAYVHETKDWQDIHATYQNKLELLAAAYKDFSQGELADTTSKLSLKEVVENPANKYVLLDFWASWCHPCMNEMPHLREAYAEFHDKGFEIFASSLDSDYATWKDCVNENGMIWIHVSDLKQWKNEAAALYNVKAIPANFLIDCSTGAIIASNLRGDDVKAKLAELISF